MPTTDIPLLLIINRRHHLGNFTSFGTWWLPSIITIYIYYFCTYQWYAQPCDKFIAYPLLSLTLFVCTSPLSPNPFSLSISIHLASSLLPFSSHTLKLKSWRQIQSCVFPMNLLWVWETSSQMCSWYVHKEISRSHLPPSAKQNVASRHCTQQSHAVCNWLHITWSK